MLKEKVYGDDDDDDEADGLCILTQESVDLLVSSRLPCMHLHS